MRDIAVVDTTLRDAHQCLWATRMTTAHMLPIAGHMDRIGFQRIDLAGTIQFDVCVRYLKEDPWERMRLMRQRITHTPLSAFTRSKNLVSFDVLPDDIVELWVERLVANGFREIGTFDGLNDVDNMLTTMNVAHRLGVKTFGALSYGLSPVHTDELYLRTAKDLIKRGKVDAIWLKDAGGLLTVDRIRTLVPAIKKVIGNVPLELHSHCMTGVAPLVYLEGIKAGADCIHSSTAPLANSNAQPSTQSMAKNLRALGFGVHVNDTLLEEVGDHFRRIAEQEGKPLGVPQEYDAFHYEHQIPGGMMSNFRSQLAQAGLSHLLQKLLEECARVRHELGFPILITPVRAVCRHAGRAQRGARRALSHGARRGEEICAGLLRQTAGPDRSRRPRPHCRERFTEDCAETTASSAGGGKAPQAVPKCQRRRAHLALHVRRSAG